MKRWIPIIVAVVCMICTVDIYAQITLTQADMPAIGTTTITAQSSTDGVTPGSGGEGQIWNFLDLDTLSLDTTTYIHPSEAPNNTAFPTANLVGFNGGGYFFYNLTPTALWGLGITAEIDEVEGLQTLMFNPMTKQVQLPATYGTTFSDSTNLEFSVETDEGTIVSKNTIVSDHEVDGYGVAITPSGTFDALRVVTVSHNIDSVWADLGGGFLFLISSGESIDTTYDFIAAESMGPLVSISYLDDGSVGSVNHWVSNITEPQAPVAQFSYEPQMDGSILFTDLSVNDPTEWEWDFGDGNISALQNPSHTYFAAGDYEVCLKVTNEIGSNTSCETITVFAAPVAAFSYSDNGGGSVDFEDTSTNSPTSWLWDFGDGNTSTLQHPQYQFLTPGVYNVCLTATNIAGENTVCETVTIIFAPIAAFTYSGNENGAIVTFEDQSSNTPTNWEWDFGDGNTSNEQNPEHTYAVSDLYTVCLTVTNDAGTNMACEEVDVIFLSVYDNLVDVDLELSPNPADDLVKVAVNDFSGSLRFTVTDAFGKVIFVNTFDTEQTFSVKDWAEGIYFYQVLSTDGSAYAGGKLMVAR